MKFLDSANVPRQVAKGVRTSGGAQHWGPEEGTVCPFCLGALMVLVSASLLVSATMLEWSRMVQVVSLLLGPAVSFEGFS